jgi:GntR family transcriptional regulator
MIGALRWSTDVPIPMGHRQLADDLQARIRRGEYAPGSQLPTYRELAELYSVSTHTASRAIGLLIDRGLVVGVQGRGTFVAEPDSRRG